MNQITRSVDEVIVSFLSNWVAGPQQVCTVCRWDVLTIQDGRGRTRLPQHFNGPKDVIETRAEWYESTQTDRQVLWFQKLISVACSFGRYFIHNDDNMTL
jgi:hypothetical protein